MRIAFVALSAPGHFDYSGYTPLCVYNWPHVTTPAALTRNRKGVVNLARMFKQANAVVKAYAERIGLKIDWDDPGSTLSPLALITQVPRAFDFESSLSNPTYRANARKLQKAIAKANGLSVAADLIEGSLGVTKKASDAG